MAKRPARQQQTDATRIGASGTGKLDKQSARKRTGSGNPRPRRAAAVGVATRDAEDVGAIRTRLRNERDETAARLRELGISPETDENAPRAGTTAALDEGDRAQASERQDMSFARRERLADRINRLSAALDRIDEGTWGRCTQCGGPIERQRLAAMPEADTCLGCQERRERESGANHAA